MTSPVPTTGPVYRSRVRYKARPMNVRLALLCFFLLATNSATACMCGGNDAAFLADLEAHGFPPDTDVFHGQVKRWISKTDVEVRVIEAFSGGSETKHLITHPPKSGANCGHYTFPAFEFVFFIKTGFIYREGFLYPAGVLQPCGPTLAAKPEILDRLRAIAERSYQVDPAALSARLKAVAAQKAADEKILSANRGESLLQPAEGAPLDPALRSHLEATRADKSIRGVRTVRVNRLAIGAPVTVLVIDGMEYRFVGEMSNSALAPRDGLSHISDAPGLDAWDGHTTSGDRAKVRRTTRAVEGQFNVGGRRFILYSLDDFGVLEELDPTRLAERQLKPEAKQKPAREESGQQAAERGSRR